MKTFLTRIALLAGLALTTGCYVETTPYPTTARARMVDTEPVVVADDEGVLSATIDVLGEIIALPFKAVGAVLDAIF